MVVERGWPGQCVGPSGYWLRQQEDWEVREVDSNQGSVRQFEVNERSQSRERDEKRIFHPPLRHSIDSPFLFVFVHDANICFNLRPVEQASGSNEITQGGLVSLSRSYTIVLSLTPDVRRRYISFDFLVFCFFLNFGFHYLINYKCEDWLKGFFFFYFWSRQGIELHVLGHECDQLDSISRRMDRD